MTLDGFFQAICAEGTFRCRASSSGSPFPPIEGAVDLRRGRSRFVMEPPADVPQARQLERLLFDDGRIYDRRPDGRWNVYTTARPTHHASLGPLAEHYERLTSPDVTATRAPSDETGSQLVVAIPALAGRDAAVVCAWVDDRRRIYRVAPHGVSQQSSNLSHEVTLFDFGIALDIDAPVDAEVTEVFDADTVLDDTSPAEA